MAAAPSPWQHCAVPLGAFFSASVQGRSLAIRDLAATDLALLCELPLPELAWTLLAPLNITDGHQHQSAHQALLGQLDHGPFGLSRIYALLKNAQSVLARARQADYLRGARFIVVLDAPAAEDTEIAMLSNDAQGPALWIHQTLLESGLHDPAALQALFERMMLASGGEQAERERLVDRLLCCSKWAVSSIFKHINGLVLIPTLHELANRGAAVFKRPFGTPEHPRSATVTDVAEAFKHVRIGRGTHEHIGHIAGALRLLALQGWMRVSGYDEQATYEPTRAGWIAATFAKSGCFDKVVQAIRNLKAYPEYFRTPTSTSALDRSGQAVEEALEEYRLLILRSEQGWYQRGSPDPLQTWVARQVQEHLDGMLVVPTMVALGLPRFVHDHGSIIVGGPSIFEAFDPYTATLRWRELDADQYHHGFLEAAFGLLVAKGLAVLDDSRQCVRLTRLGKAVRQRVTSYGVTNAYLNLYEVLHELFFGDPGILNVDNDEHMGDKRVEDIWGSSGAHGTYLPALKNVVQPLFSRPPAQQPAGLLDVGAGDGRMAAALGESILTDTTRGQVIRDRPLVLIASDAVEASRSRALATLEELRKRLHERFLADPGLHNQVLSADVTDPDALDRSVRALDIPNQQSGQQLGLADFVVTMMFTAHERAIVMRTVDQALGMLEQCVEQTDRRKLWSVLEPLARELDTTDLPATFDEFKRAQRSDIVRWVAQQFTTSHVFHGELIPAVVSAADHVVFLKKWGRYANHALVMHELYTPRLTPELQERLQRAPANPYEPTIADRVAAPAYWGTHYPSHQYLVPFGEYQLVLVLAGLTAGPSVVFPSKVTGDPTTVGLTVLGGLATTF